MVADETDAWWVTPAKDLQDYYEGHTDEEDEGEDSDE